MTYAEIRNTWRRRSKRSDADKVLSLCELRTLIIVNLEQRSQLIADFAEDYGAAKATVKDWLHIIGDYDKELMLDWLDKGLFFNHFEKARTCAAAKQMTPAALLDFAVDNGPEGKTMTVDEMVSFAIGEKPSGGARRNFQRYYDGLMKLPAVYKWDEPTRAEFEAAVNTLWKFFK